MKALKPVTELDLAWIASRLVEKKEFDRVVAEKAVTEYRTFLQIVVENPTRSVGISALADHAWHMHILDTRRYAEDCQAIAGFFIHHEPNALDEVTRNAAWALNLAETTRLCLKTEAESAPCFRPDVTASAPAHRDDGEAAPCFRPDVTASVRTRFRQAA